MAVYTEVADEALEAFIASYDIGELTACKGISEGVENTNYLLHTTSGNFILTLYEKRVDPAELPFFLGLMDHLAARGVASPTPVRDRQGQILRQLAERPAAIVTFLEGMSVKRPKPVHCAQLGRALAKMHLAGAEFAIARPNALSLGGWQRMADGLAQEADQVHPGLSRVIADELGFLDANWPRHLPVGVIHADLFPNNVFFRGEALSGLIDFYFACNDLLAYDIAVCLNAWCFESRNEFNSTKARAMLSAYQQVRPIGAEEMAALPILARGAALRFLLTRAHDWLHTPDGALVQRLDPFEYLTKLRFHQQVQSAGEYGLEHAA